MNKRDLEPLPTEVGAMLDTLKPVDAVPIDVRARLRSRVLVSVGASGASGATAAPASAPVSKSAGWWLGAGVGLGLGLGLAVFLIATSGEREDEAAESVIAPPQVERAIVEREETAVERPEGQPVRLAPVHEEIHRTREAVAPARVREPVDRQASPPAASVTETETASQAAETTAQTAASDRAEQRAIVERARSALAAGRTADATSALDEYERRFGVGPYAEEAAALRVRVLLASGRRDDAREKAQRFLERYPNSIFRDVLGPALRE
jgi:hypothetical protein